MSHSTGKKSSSSGKSKVQRTPFGVKVMGLGVKEPSPSLMSFGAGVLNDEPVVETCVSGDSSFVSENVAVEGVAEEVFVDSGLQIVEYVPPVSPVQIIPLKVVYPVPDSPGPVLGGSSLDVVGCVSSDETLSDEVPLKRNRSAAKPPVNDVESPILIHSEDESSDNVPLASIARSLKKRARVSEEVTPASTVKKAKVGEGSSKSRMSVKKSKGKKMFVSSSKRKSKRSSERLKSVSFSDKKGKAPVVDVDVELDVPDIRSSRMKKKSASKSVEHDVRDIRSEKKKKKPERKGESSVPMFNSEASKDRWPFVVKRRIPIERPLGSDVKECEEVVALIERAGLLKTVSGFGKCHVQLLREFISNLSLDVTVPGSDSFHRVFVRGKCVVFSPSIINSALDRSEDFYEDDDLNLDLVAKEISAGSVQVWPPKKLLSSGVLSVKYAILSRIGMLDWIPSHHTSAISVSLARLIFRIGTGIPIDFGSFVFMQTMKHAESFAIKLPISFPSLLTDIMLKQYPDLLKSSDVAMPRGPVITLDHKLFQDPHVLDIALPASRTSASLSVSGTKSVLEEMEDLSKELQEQIRVSILRKEKVDSLIYKLKEEGASAVGTRSVEEEGDEEEAKESETDSKEEDAEEAASSSE